MIEPTQLKKISIFGHLSDGALAKVAAALETKELEARTVLFNQGDPGNELFVVQRGRIAIYVPSKDKPGEERPIRIFEAEEVLGEMALIDDQPRSASARALEASTVLALSGDDFQQLLRQYPEMAIAVMAGLNDRIRYTTNFLGEVRGWVKRVAEGKYDHQFTTSSGQRDRSISALAAEFAQMAAQVQQREKELQKELTILRVQIDDKKRKRQVDEIVDSDYFQSLKSQARKLRGQD